MKTTRITLIVALIVISGSSVMAQGFLGKLAGAAKSTNDASTVVSGATNSVDNALGTVNQVSETANALKGLFGKKKKKEAEATAVATLPAGAKMTVVSVANADFAILKKLNDNIKACGIVLDSKMKYGSSGSTIEVTHKESTDELLKLMQETSKDVFTEKNIEAVEDGKIGIKLNH